MSAEQIKTGEAAGRIIEIKRLVTEGADITTRGFDNTVAMVAAYWNDSELLKQSL